MNAATAFPLDDGGPKQRPYAGYEDDWLNQPVIRRFQLMVERHADRVAIRDETGSLSYAELWHKVLKIGQALATSVAAEAPVALALEVDRHYPAAMLGALAAGRPYVPLDLHFPEDRIRHILQHSGVGIVLVSASTRHQMAGLIPPGIRLLAVEDLPLSDPEWLACGRADDIAYILYTSGSTGSPKGVFQNQRGLTHDVLQFTRSVHVSHTDIFSGVYSPSVNGAIRDIYSALLNGATLGVLDLRRLGFGNVATLTKEWGITIFHAMPPVLRSFLRQAGKREDLASVRLTYLAGDQLFSSDLVLLREFFADDALLYTGIGSSECATIYRQWFVPRDWQPDGGKVPVGRGIPERTMELLDAGGKPVALGETGEIAVTSAYLARGYWRDPEQTWAKFEALPDGTFRYRTGDLGRIRVDGLLEFIGRSDRQVKIRGFRVEPAETEAVLRAQPEIIEAAVLVRRNDSEAALVAYVQIRNGAEIPVLRQRIERLLPAHLCPGEFIELEALPTLGNFKLDYRGLEILDEQYRDAKRQSIRSTGSADALLVSTETVQPDMVTALVCKVWVEVLHITHVDNDTAFGNLGGDSLKALELHLALERAFGRQIPMTYLSLDMTPDSLARYLEKEPHVQLVTAGPLLIIFPAAGGISVGSRIICDGFLPYFDVHQINYPEPETMLRGAMRITALAASAIVTIEKLLASGRPAILLGISYGARVAHEAAVQLLARALPVDLVVLDDVTAGGIFSFPAVSQRTNNRGSRLRRLMRRIKWTSCAIMIHLEYLFKPKVFAAAARLAAVLPDGMGLGENIRILQRIVLQEQQIRKWQPQQYPGSALLLQTDLTRRENQYLPADMGWADICTRLSIQELPGRHDDTLKPPNLIRVVEAIQAAMQTTDGKAELSDSVAAAFSAKV